MNITLRNLTIPARLVLSILAFVVPFAVLLTFFIKGIGKDIEFARQELRGNAYQRPVMVLFAGVTRYRLLAAETAAGQPGAAGEAPGLAGAIDEGFRKLAATDRELGAALQFTPEGLGLRKREGLTVAKIEGGWRAIAGTKPSTALPGDDPALALIASLRGVITHLGDTSNLILDPDLDSYYLMDVTLLALPQTADRVAAITHDLMRLLASGRALTQEERVDLAARARLLAESDLERVRGSIATALNEDPNFYGPLPSLAANLAKPVAAYETAATELIRLMEGIAKGEPSTVATALQSGEAARLAAFALWDAAVVELDKLLEARIAHYRHYRLTALAAFGAALVTALAFFFLVARSITAPLKTLQQTMLTLADGNLDAVVPCREQRDELGDMARAVETFRQISIRARELASQEERALRERLARQERLDRLIGEFRQEAGDILLKLGQAATGMGAVAEAMVRRTETAEERTAKTVQVADRTAGEVGEVARASEELAVAIREITAQVGHSSNVTQRAVQTTGEADGVVDKLSDAASEIGSVINLINTIADQIKLLALNATIEAARAGEAGKGFAVVAAEVKALAAQTGEATGSIAAQVLGVQEVTTSVVTVLQTIRRAISEIDMIAATIAAAVEQQGSATRAIAGNVQTVAGSMTEVSIHIGEVGGLSRHTATDAREVLAAVQGFTCQAMALRSQVENFLAKIAAE